MTSPHEREQLGAAIRDFLAARSNESAVRTVAESEQGWDPDVWRALAQQLGVQSLSVPTEHGGDGYGALELAVVLREMGRALLPAPYFSTIALAVPALTASGDPDAQAACLPGIATGETTATVAVAESTGAWTVDSLETKANQVDGSWQLSGTKWFVVDGASADVLIVAASTPDGPRFFVVMSGAAGLTRSPQRTLDTTRRLARLDLDATNATPLGGVGDTTRILDAVLTTGTALLAAEQVGGATACLQASTAYARERIQFGRQIGSFQAIKHKCADMFARIQLADAAAVEAASALTGVPDSLDPAVAAAVAHAVCSEAYLFAATENIQVHGGIGFTWEHPAHLYFRRAKSSQLLFGGPGVYYERLLQVAGI